MDAGNGETGIGTVVPGGTRARRLAWSIWAVGVLLAVAALAFLVLGRDTPPPPGTFGFRGFAVVFFATFGTVGALVASRHPKNPIGWIFLAMGVGSAFQEVTQQYAIYAVLAAPDLRLPFGVVAGWFPSWIWVPITSGAAYLLLLFPDGHLPSVRWRIVVVAELAGTVAAAVGLALLPGPLENFASVDNPFALGSRSTMLAVNTSGQLVYGLGIVASAVALVGRFRRARGEDRQRLKWLAASGIFLAATLFVSFVLTPRQADVGGAYFVIALLVIAGFSSVPIATGIAILRHRLYDVEVVINKTVVYGLLGVFITVVYVGFVVGIGTAVGRRGSAVLSGVAAAAVAVVFQPARRAAQRLANRLVYGRRATPYEILAGFSDRLAGAYSVEDILPRMARVLTEGTGVIRTSVWLNDGTTFSLAASWPAAPHARTIPLDSGDLPELPPTEHGFAVRHQGDLLGAITVSMPPGETPTPTQERLFSDVAAQAGLVLRNVRLVADLRASRQRLVAAQDEERRRIERNIHDGAQQQLVALAVKERLAESMIGRDDERLRSLLGEIQADTTATLNDLRDLARGIYPPLLADKGLAAALEAQARRSPVPVRVDADGAGRLPQEIEAATYFCVLEALQNVAKYARASSATVRIANEDSEVRFEVRDDGRGFDPSASTGGTGLQGMADRLSALGGRLEVRSSPGAGTSVSAVIPVERGVRP